MIFLFTSLFTTVGQTSIFKDKSLVLCVCMPDIETLILLSSFQWSLFQLFSNGYEKQQLRNLPMNNCRSFPLRPREDDIDKVLSHTMSKWVNKKHKGLTSSHFEPHLCRGYDSNFLEVIERHVGTGEARGKKGYFTNVACRYAVYAGM